jgi:hypothetical protein
VFAAGAIGLRAWFWKLVVFALIWAYLLHFCAGLRHLWMDATHAVDQRFGHVSALASAASSRWPSAPSFSSSERQSTSFGSRRLVVGAHYGLFDCPACHVAADGPGRSMSLAAHGAVAEQRVSYRAINFKSVAAPVA